MIKIQKHHTDDVSGTKGRWMPSLIAGSLTGPDGHALTHDEIVVISCPGCGAPQGIGADEVKIVDGKTDRPWRCYDKRCRYEVDCMEFEKHQELEGREHFARLKDKAQTEIHDARARHVQHLVTQNMMAELHDRAKAEAQALFPDAKDPAVYKKVLDDLLRKTKAR